MSTDFSVSTHGYTSPSSPYRHAPARLASSVTIEKRIGVLYWNEDSGVEFGTIDINIQDGGKDSINGTVVDWVEWAKENLNPQVVIAIEQSDGTLQHIATADATDVSFPNDRTIRVSLQTKHGRQLDQFVNDYVPEDSTYDGEIQGLPIPTLLGAGQATPPSYPGYGSFEPRTHFKTLQVDPTNLRYMVTFLDADLVSTSPGAYYVMDRGAVLREGESPGFTLWENGFELTSNPDGEITFTWMSEEGGGVEDPLETGELLQGHFRICRWAVWKSGIDTATFFPSISEFPDLQPGTITDDEYPALSYTGEVSARTILNDCVVQSDGFWYVNEFGDFVFGKFTDPQDETPDFVYDDSDLIGDISVTVDRAPGLSTRMNYSYSPGAIDINNLAGSITNEARRQRLSREWLEMGTEASVIDVYDTAFGHKPMKFYAPGLFDVRVRDELNRRWTDYYSGIRRFYRFTIPVRGDEALPELGDIVTIQSDRSTLFQFGPLSLLVRRIRYTLGEGLVQIEGWGGETPDPPPVPDAPDLSASSLDDTTAQLDWTMPT
jgi:hypothetical protein